MSAVLSRDVVHDDPEILRQAYNSAFEELGLAWHWDRATYAGLPAGRPGVRAYLEREHPHLLRAYEADFLVDAIETAKSRCESMMKSRVAA
ncbi:MAG: hypothetical protein ACXWC6_10905 [Ramlibacter sp.]